jgi:PTH1 family peptidyl-tRNA hydrolase
MWILVGLGNPGAEYATSRHNAGFMVVDTLAARWRVPLSVHAGVRSGHGVVAGQPALLIEPQTFMNRSGDAVAAFLPAVDDRLVVIYDDLDLPSGRLRIRPRGGSGGHRGVASIVERVGQDFARVRVGIGRPPAGSDAVGHVLDPLPADELAGFRAAVARAADAVEYLIGSGIEAAMNRFNTGTTPSDLIEKAKE